MRFAFVAAAVVAMKRGVTNLNHLRPIELVEYESPDVLDQQLVDMGFDLGSFMKALQNNGEGAVIGKAKPATPEPETAHGGSSEPATHETGAEI